MSLPPIGKDFYGRDILHAADCICAECRAADWRKSMIERNGALERRAIAAEQQLAKANAGLRLAGAGIVTPDEDAIARVLAKQLAEARERIAVLERVLPGKQLPDARGYAAIQAWCAAEDAERKQP